jgi:hypothetical protein
MVVEPAGAAAGMGFLALKPSVGLCRVTKDAKASPRADLKDLKELTTGLYSSCIIRLVATSSLASVPLDGIPLPTIWT